MSYNASPETFGTKGKLRQKGSFSPSLFIIFIREIIKKQAKIEKFKVGHLNLNKHSHL